MRKKMFILYVSLLWVLLSSCATQSFNGNYFELDDYDKLTSFSAHKGDVYYVDYSFVVNKGYVDLIVYNKKTRDIVFTTSIKKKAKYQGSFNIPRSGIYIVEMDGYKASGQYKFKLNNEAISKNEATIEHMDEMLLTNTKNHDFEIERWKDKKNTYYNVTFKTDYTGVELCTFDGIKNENSGVIAGNYDRQDDLVALPTTVDVWKSAKTMIHFNIPNEKTIGGMVICYIPIEKDGETLSKEIKYDRILFHK
ncbi:hypothetical protein V7148_18370 [Gottfriedia acidiceleris]|uniref:hypothetical protein n=2 Tax=Bacillales TaxID=1385 RepID=UPI000BEC526D|nr:MULTISPECIES: hypothetical protein [unclassified Bacillus (in: firmicutes)]PEC48764.1 hypothetical protein CON00_14380 [Bacillus sp. AFS096315]PFM82783.1 hypothetical protein COJ46_02950 [Bacillus sp. AFS077874]